MACGKRAANEAFVDLTLDSDEDPLIVAPAAKRSSSAPAGSPEKPVVVVGTPAGMRSRELQARLRQFGAPESEIKGCIEKRDLVALHDRYQRAHSTRGTPPTVLAARSHSVSAKLEPSSSSAAYLSSMLGGMASRLLPAWAQPGGAASGGIAPAHPVPAPAQSMASAKSQIADRIAVHHAQALHREQQAREAAASRLAVDALHSLSRALTGGRRGRGPRARCGVCFQRPHKCRCAAGLIGGGSARGGAPYGLGGSARDEDMTSRAEEQLDQEVGLDHKDADEQTFTDYVPHTFQAPVFKKHPDPVVETASLASLVPPKTTHKLRLCAKTITQGLLTSVQLETINLACQQHELRLPVSGARAAFFMGDGPGVGKGRQAAGIILENYLHGRERALWFSVSGDLVADARRDIEDIGGGKVTCCNLKDYKAGLPLERQGLKKGILFCTYSLLISERSGAAKVERARLQQIIEWCGAEQFEGALILDECHRAKNMGAAKAKSGKDDSELDLEDWKKTTGTKSALFVASLQEQLPLARIVYLSATGASDPKHFCNLSRLGLWGPSTAFKDQNDFITDMHKGGIGAMELVAMHMKATGQYLARSLSFKDATFEIQEVKLSAEFQDMYNKAVEIWQKLIAHPEWWMKPNASGYGKPRNMMGLLWAANLRFWSQMIMAAKIPEVVEIVKTSLADGMCAVIGLQSTGEAGSGSQDDSVDELFSNAANAILKLVEDYCCPGSDEDKEELLEEIRGLKLPPNPLDDLIAQLGGPSKVAEMTGRSTRWVKSTTRGKDNWKLTKRVKGDRSELTINIEERKAFQSGRKLVAIISEAASSGISLQADRRCGNQRRRVHITLQLPWASDQVVQQMGRSHRSNQSSAPIFKLIMTPIGGEWRFASAVARRLQALGALTQGDRRASGTGGRSIQAYNIEAKYGNLALKELMEELAYGFHVQGNKGTPDFIAEAHPDKSPGDSLRKFLEDAREALEAAGFGPDDFHTSKAQKLKIFLNRVLGVKLELQNLLFRYFMWLMSERITKDKNSGDYQEGIVDIAGDTIDLVKLQDLFECPRTGAKTQRALLRTDRGVSWDKAQEILKEHLEYAKEHGVEDSDSGFYSSKDAHDHVASATPVVLVLQQRTGHGMTGSMRSKFFHVIRPNTGHSAQLFDRDHIRHNFQAVLATSASTKTHWDKLFTFYEKKCGHKQCHHLTCSYKKRTQQHHLIVGLVLPFWKDIKRIVVKGHAVPKVVRVQPTDGSSRLVGLRVWPEYIDQVCDVITRGAAAGSGAEDDREERIVSSPFHRVISTLALHDCLNPAARDNVAFDLPHNWNKDPTTGDDVSCMVFIYEIPLQNALLDQKHVLKPAKWKNDCQLRIVDERTMQETIITVPTSAVAKNAVIAKPVVIDKYVKQGANKLRVQSIGERFCLVVRLIASRSLGDVLSDLSKIDDAAENLKWGKEALLTQLGAGDDEDDELMITELDVSLKDPLSCARIKTPARGHDCQHFTCFDLETYLQYAHRYGSWKCQLCSKELNPREIKVCQRFQEILSKTDCETESCKLNAEFEISNAKREVIGEKGKIDGIDAKKPDAGAAANDNSQLHQAAVPAGTLEEQLQQTNLWEYTKEAEDFFQNPPPSANAGKASPSDNEDIEEDEAESSADEKPVLSLGRGRSRLRARSEESEASSLSGDSSREVEDEMELADDATTDDEGGRGSAKAGSSKGKAKTKDKGKGKGKGKQAQGGGAFRSSSRPMRSARANRNYVIETDDDDDFEVEAVGDVSDKC